MGDTITQIRSERVSKLFNDSLLARSNKLQSNEDSMKLNELMELCTTLQSRVLDLEKKKTTQAFDIDSLKRRVKKLEKKQRSRTHKLKRLYKVGLTARVESSYDEQSLDLDGEEVFVAKQDENVVEKEVDAAQVQVSTVATTATISIDEVTLAQALSELKHTKPKAKAKGIVFHEPEESTTTTATIPKPKSQDKGKAIMIDEPMKLKKKDQIILDEEVALKLQAALQAEFDKEQRLAITTAGTRVKTVIESYYCHYKEVTAAQDEVSAAQKLQRNIQNSQKKLSKELDRLRPFVEEVERMGKRCHDLEVEKDSLLSKESSLQEEVAALSSKFQTANLERVELALNEVHSLGSSWDFKDVKDYNPDAEKIFDEAPKAFYKLEFPYISFLVEKVDQSL
nr:hypothetical protein [Tanacetum cinerariifolium]